MTCLQSASERSRNQPCKALRDAATPGPLRRKSFKEGSRSKKPFFAASSIVPKRWMSSADVRNWAWKRITRDRLRMELNVSGETPMNRATWFVSNLFQPANSSWRVWMEYGSLGSGPISYPPPSTPSQSHCLSTITNTHAFEAIL